MPVRAMMCNLRIQDRTCSQRPISDLASGAWIPEKHPGRTPIQRELLEGSSAEPHSPPRAQLVLSRWSAGISCAPELSGVGVLPGLRADSLVSVPGLGSTCGPNSDKRPSQKNDSMMGFRRGLQKLRAHGSCRPRERLSLHAPHLPGHTSCTRSLMVLRPGGVLFFFF